MNLLLMVNCRVKTLIGSRGNFVVNSRGTWILGRGCFIMSRGTWILGCSIISRRNCVLGRGCFIVISGANWILGRDSSIISRGAWNCFIVMSRGTWILGRVDFLSGCSIVDQCCWNDKKKKKRLNNLISTKYATFYSISRQKSIFCIT